MTKPVKNYQTPWTDQVVDRMKVLHAEGASAAVSAATLTSEFGIRFTRNAVIGIWHRKGLSVAQVDRPIVVRKRRRQPVISRAPLRSHVRPAQPEFAPVPVVERFAAVDPRHITLIELEQGDCRYPYGQGASITFCGCSAVPGRPYCHEHELLTGPTLEQARNRSEAAKAVWERRPAKAA